MNATNRTHVFSVFGTRPEVIKMVPVLRELGRRTDRFRSTVVLTGQHRDMCAPFLDRFDIRPDYDLEIMEPNQTPDTIVHKVLQRLPQLLEQSAPDVVVVQGDTSTAFAASLAAFHQRIPIAHVEAGLRSGNRHSPFPEEVNRQLVGVLADLHFAPTQRARDNLVAENVDESTIFITGNTVIDTLLLSVNSDYKFEIEPLRSLDFDRSRVIAVTTHRRENFGERLDQFIRALRRIIELYEDVEIVIPVHFNPNVRVEIYRRLGNLDRVHLIEPLGYEPFVQLLDRAYLVLTDSGGVQEEAPSLGKPVLVLRDTTERPEGIEAGTAKLSGVTEPEIVANVRTLLDDSGAYRKMSHAVNPYGDGTAGKRIVDLLSERLSTV